MSRSAIEIGKRTLIARTCRICGKLKSLGDLQRSAKGYWHSRCKQCKHKQSDKRAHRHNVESQRKARNARTSWESWEISHLEELVEKGLSHKEIAATLGRSIASITMAKHRFLKEMDDE